MNNVSDGFRDERPPARLRLGERLKLFFDSRVVGLKEFSELVSDSGDKRKGSFKKEDNGSHLSQDICPWSINDSWFFEDFDIFLDGTCLIVLPPARRAYAPEGSGPHFLDGVVALGTPGDFIDQARMLLDRHVFSSVGSVVPLFERQIKWGGPVTVTDREVTRYFMSIREAARLILQAGALGTGGERRADPQITPVPSSRATGQAQITRIRENGDELTLKKMRKHIKRLVRLAEACDGEGIREELKRVVPEYHPQGG